jgi:hypothetical protein
MTPEHYKSATVNVPEVRRNKVCEPATMLHGQVGHVLKDERGLGACALFWPAGSDKYEFVPRAWLRIE